MSTFESYQRQVVEMSQELTRKGLLMGTGGNVSVRIAGRDALAITPSNYDYLKMVPADVCIIGIDLAPLRDVSQSSPWAPSIESGMHAAIYASRPDVNVVIHTHQVTASAAALMGKAIPALFDEQVRYLGKSVELVPYGPSGTGWLKSNIVRKLKNRANAYLLQNHGALVLGPDVERAMFNVELLEKCTAAYLLAYYTGERMTRVPLPIREIIFAKLKKTQETE